MEEKHAHNCRISVFSARLGISGHSKKQSHGATPWKSRRSCMASASEKKIKAENNGFWHLLGFAVFLQGVKPSSGVGSQASEKKTSKKIRKKDEKH